LIPEPFWDQLLARCSVPGSMIFCTTNPDAPNHWLRKRFILRAGELDLKFWHFMLDDNPSLEAAYVNNLKMEYSGLWYRRYVLGEWCMAEGAVYDMFDPDRDIVDTLPLMERWIGVDYGTVNPFNALLVGVSVPDQQGQRRLYFASELRYDSKKERRQLTDAEYSKRLQHWLAHPGQLRPRHVRGAAGLARRRPQRRIVRDPAVPRRVRPHPGRQLGAGRHPHGVQPDRGREPAGAPLVRGLAVRDRQLQLGRQEGRRR
jgi:hypothetical protein